MSDTILKAFLFFLPAGIANMTPVLANKVPLLNQWNTPLDFGLKYKGERILGDNKRWRGLIFGALLASLTALILQVLLSRHLPYTSVAQAASAGFILGFGALVGDAAESFFKRQKGLEPGQSWFPFDQIDYIIGGLIFIYPVIKPSLQMTLIIFVLFFGLHLASAYVGFLLKLKDQPI
jgi:CDP-2,3-bis-(O-geranylgeranyl)-sn-glycerol synthase